jgi:hypothetical protein
MNVLFPKRKVKSKGPGVKSVEVPRLHIGWNEEDTPMWGALPFRSDDGELAYNGGAVIVIRECPDNIRISIIKSHTGRKHSKIGEVRVIDDTHATEIIIDNAGTSNSPRITNPFG